MNAWIIHNAIFSEYDGFLISPSLSLLFVSNSFWTRLHVHTFHLPPRPKPDNTLSEIYIKFYFFTLTFRTIRLFRIFTKCQQTELAYSVRTTKEAIANYITKKRNIFWKKCHICRHLGYSDCLFQRDSVLCLLNLCTWCTFWVCHLE